jgi:hypothetical protein
MIYPSSELYPEQPEQPEQPEHIALAYRRFNYYIDNRDTLKPKDLAEWLMLEEQYITYKRDEI